MRSEEIPFVAHAGIALFKAKIDEVENLTSINSKIACLSHNPSQYDRGRKSSFEVNRTAMLLTPYSFIIV